MNLDPFSDPFGIGPGQPLKDFFTRYRPGRGPARGKPEPAAPIAEERDSGIDPESEAETEAERENPREKVVLKNPKWEIEEVGFNEETDISVEAELPAAEAHKTKVSFELFAKTPDGEESISKAEGNISTGHGNPDPGNPVVGKAVAKIPVYFPQYKDDDGNLLPEVEYYFSAKHSASDLLKDDSVVMRAKGMASLLLESHILEDVTFASGKSQVLPSQAPRLKALTLRISDWKRKHPDGKIVIFGHADAEGREEPNKLLSERRAKSIHAFLMKDASAWDGLAREEKWDRTIISDVKAFMDENNALSLSGKDFDAIDGKPYAGCSEFNLVEAKQGAHEPNRRVSVFLLKSNRNFPIQYPCKQGDIAPCKAQVGRKMVSGPNGSAVGKGGRRTPGFSCLFYDKLILESKTGAGAKGTVRFAGISGAEIKQYVNMTAEEGKPELGIDRLLEVEVHGLRDGDGVYWTVTAGEKNSLRTDPKTGPRLTAGEKPAEFKERVATIVSKIAGGRSKILLACGVAGGDEFIVEAGGSRDKADCKVKIVTWRRLEYETIHPLAKGNERLTDWTVFTPDKGPGLPAQSTQYLDKVLGQAFVEFKEIGKDTYAGIDLPNQGRYNIFDGSYVGKTEGTKIIVSTTSQLGEVLGTKTKHRKDNRVVSVAWCDYLTIPKILNQSFEYVFDECSRDTDDSVFENVIGTSSIAAHGDYSISILSWKVTHWFDPSAPGDDVWKLISRPNDPGYVFRNGGVFTDDGDIRAHIQFKGIHTIAFKFPSNKAEYPGKILQRDNRGCFVDKGRVLGLTLAVNGIAGNTNFNGMALQGRIWMNTFAGSVHPIGMAGVIAHELGHNMGQAYGDKRADDYFGRPNDKPIPGIPFPEPVPTGNVYGGHGHQGTHCAMGVTDRTEDDFTKEGSNAFSEHACLMFGATDMTDGNAFTFCDDCLNYIRAENLSDIKRSWRS